VSSGRARALLGFAAFGAFWGTWGAVLPQLQRHARVDDAQLGTALLIIGLGAMVSIRIVGGLADRYPRLTLPVSLAALGLSATLPVVAVGVVGLSATAFALGMCSGAADSSINAAAARTEATGQAALNLGHGLFSAAVVVASLGVADFGATGSGRPFGLVVIAAVVIAASVGCALLPVAPEHPRSAAAPSKRRRSWPLILLGVLAAVAYLVENAWQSWGAIQLHSTLDATSHVAALAPAVFAGSAAIARFAGHHLSAAVPAWKLISSGAALAAAASLLAALAPTVSLALIGIAIAGLGTGVCGPTLIATASRRSPAATGAATGTVITLAYSGFVFGPAAVGLLSEATTLPTALVGVAGAAAILAAVTAAVRNLGAGILVDPVVDHS
jgi:MFS family permease